MYSDKIKKRILPILLKCKRLISFLIKETNIFNKKITQFPYRSNGEVGQLTSKVVTVYVSAGFLLFKYSGMSTTMLVLLGFRSLKLRVIQPFKALWQPFSNWLVLFAQSGWCSWTWSTHSMFANSFTQRKDHLYMPRRSWIVCLPKRGGSGLKLKTCLWQRNAMKDSL